MDTFRYLCKLLIVLINVEVLFANTDNVINFDRLEDVDHVTICRDHDVLKVSFQINNRNVLLNLTRQRGAIVHPPVYTVKAHTRHGFKVVKENTEYQPYHVYEDIATLCSFTVRCSQSENRLQSINGHFIHDGREYMVSEELQKSRTRRDAHLKKNADILPNFKASPIDTNKINVNDFMRPDNADVKLNFRKNNQAEDRTARSKRATQPSYYIDVVAYVESSIYNKFYSRSNFASPATRRNDAISKIREYYAHVVKGMDHRYRSISNIPFTINVNLAGVIISESMATSPWETYVSNNLVGDSALLSRFNTYIRELADVPLSDHIMLFCGHDLYSTDSSTGQTSTSSTGMAYIDTLCETNGNSLSVVEEPGGFQSIKTATHELGHSLNGLHDGYGNTCNGNDRFIMAAGPATRTTANLYNPWFFSYCSVNSFIKKIEELLVSKSVAKKYCLTRKEYDPLVPDVSYMSLGQVYLPEAICEDVMGPGSYFCRGAITADPTDSVCTHMFCRDPATDNTCIQLTAPTKTTCGNKKWCLDGRCQYDLAAPYVDDNCVFGDQKGVAFSGKTCEQLIRDRPSACYQDVVIRTCCASCRAVHTQTQGCEYGDRIGGCHSSMCQYETYQGHVVSRDCCQTCNTGSPITTPRPTVQPTITTCSDVTRLDGGDTCLQYIQRNPAGKAICYQGPFYERCCQTCLKLRDDTTADCGWGNQNPQYCTERANTTTHIDCLKNGSKCCDSCDVSTTASGVVKTTPAYSLVVFVVTITVTSQVLGCVPDVLLASFR